MRYRVIGWLSGPDRLGRSVRAPPWHRVGQSGACLLGPNSRRSDWRRGGGRGSERLSVRGRTSLSIQLSGRSLNLGFGGGSLKSDKALQPSRPSAPGHVLLGAGGNGSKECSRDRISGASIPIGSAGLAVVSSSARAWSVIPARAFARHLCAGSTECRTCDTRGLPGGMRSREPCGQVGRH